MPAEALYTTFRIHKQLEVFFQDKGLFYERRKGYWRDKRKPISKIVSALSLVQAVVAIMVGRTDAAKGRPRDYINQKDKRYEIFGHDEYDDSKQMSSDVAKFRPYDFEIYLRCWQIIKRVDQFLNLPELHLDNESRRNLLYYMARAAACTMTKNAHCPPGELLKVDLSLLTDDFMRTQCLQMVKRIYKRNGGNDEAGKNPKTGEELQRKLVKMYSPTKQSKAAMA